MVILFLLTYLKSQGEEEILLKCTKFTASFDQSKKKKLSSSKYFQSKDEKMLLK